MESETSEMVSHINNDCHPGSDQKSDEASHPDCDWGFICACNIGQSQLSDEDYVPTHKNTVVTLTETGAMSPLFRTEKVFLSYYQPRIGEYKPPLWLMYDTFLM